MLTRRLFLGLGAAIIVAAVSSLAVLTREHWTSWLGASDPRANAEDAVATTNDKPKLLELSLQARKNLGLVSSPVALQQYWSSIQVPGVIVDRPGHSDRGVTAPAVTTVAKIHAYPGDIVRVGERLFTLRLISEYLHNSQSELFKNTREIQFVEAERQRLLPLAGQAVAATTLIEVENKIKRFTAAAHANRQELLARGLSPAQLEDIVGGNFISEIDVVAPPPSTDKPLLFADPASLSTRDADSRPVYEVQELKVELGQQVQAGQTLSMLANHQSLYIEGHSFRHEAPALEQAAQNGWPVQVEFVEKDANIWPTLEQQFQIRHLANTVDLESRTFNFYIPLTNQARAYQKDGKSFLVWRFRPGQRVRLRVPVEEFRDVIVLPPGAVAREGPEAYVFRQNGDLFDRRPVHVVFEDRSNVVLANDGSVVPGMYVAQSGAASLNRVLKAQAGSGGLPPGAHFHADGSLHVPGK